MKWVWACMLLVFLLLPMSYAAGDSNPNPSLTSAGTATQAQSYADLPGNVVKALADMEQRLADDFHAFNDENFKLFDGVIKEYQKRLVVGILGAALLAFGLVAFYLMQSNRKASFESSEVRRREKEEERKYIVDSLNYIRDRVDKLEEQASEKLDLSVVPLEEIDKEYHRRRQRQSSDEYDDFDRRVGEFVNKHGGVSYGDQSVPLEEERWGQTSAEAPRYYSEDELYGRTQSARRGPETRYV